VAQTAREQGHKLAVLVPSPGAPLPGSKAVEPSHPSYGSYCSFSPFYTLKPFKIIVVQYDDFLGCSTLVLIVPGGVWLVEVLILAN